MSESLGHASANQQHYLDLGYTDSVVQTRAAEWTAATELPLPSLAKGIMKASSLMNRWGVFGHNGAENAEVFVNRFPEHEIYSPHTVPTAQLKNINRKWNYIVTNDGKLIVGKGGQFPGGGHIDLASGQPVKAAGEVRIVNGQIKYIDNSIGHYLPSGLSAQQIAEKAFLNLDSIH